MTLGWIYLVHSSGRRQTKKKKKQFSVRFVDWITHWGIGSSRGSPREAQECTVHPQTWRRAGCPWVDMSHLTAPTGTVSVISDGVFRIRPWIRLYLFEVNMHPMAPESRHQHGCNAIVRGFPHWWTKPPPTNSPVNHRSIRMFLPLFFCALWPDPPGTQTEALLSRRASKQPHPSGPQRGEHTAPQHPTGTQPHAQDPFPCSPHNPSHHPAGAPHPASRPSPQRAAPKWPPGGRAAAVAAP